MTFRKLLHLFRLFVAIMIVPALALIIWGELTPQPLPDGLENYWDKLLHFTAYFGLALMATIAVRGDRRARYWIIGLVVLGGILEIAQTQVGRDGDWHDELANALGVLAGWSIAFSAIALLKSRKLIEDVRKQD